MALYGDPRVNSRASSQKLSLPTTSAKENARLYWVQLLQTYGSRIHTIDRNSVPWWFSFGIALYILTRCGSLYILEITTVLILFSFVRYFSFNLRSGERERENMHMSGREGEKQTPCSARSPTCSSIPGPGNHDLSGRQTFNQLSHQVPLLCWFLHMPTLLPSLINL